MVVLTDTCSIIMLLRIAPEMFSDERFGCVTIQTVHDEIRQTAKFSVKYPWRNEFLPKIKAIPPGLLLKTEYHVENGKTVARTLDSQRNSGGAPYGLSRVDREVVTAALTLSDLTPEREVKISSTDRNRVRFASKQFGLENLEPLALINQWLRDGLIEWDENRNNLLFAWLSDGEPSPRREAIREFERLTGRKFPRP